MKKLIALFGRGALLAIVALVLLSVAVWFGGPYIAIADHKPFEPVTGRLVAILVLVVAWGLWTQLRQISARKSGEQLASGIVAQKDAPLAATEQPVQAAADAAPLRRRFEEAIATLRKSGGAHTSLYELPWYVVIGPPGSGKTTAIANSGLGFPLEKTFGRVALRGVGGTRNCDWWFTDRAVLLDTAGRYTTQDSNPASDAASWLEFLALLKKYRRRRPINGVLVAMSAADLLMTPEAARREHSAAIRQRLQELHERLQISLPVYFLVTKCDLLAGFDELFDDLTQEARAQVWGTTFALDLSRSGEAAERLAPEVDALLERLDERTLARIELERDVQRRAQIFSFPRQFAALRSVLCEFVAQTFGGSDLTGKTLLRGVYFTSGTQDGTPIDRMLSVLARTFGLRVQGEQARTGRGKAYFIHKLLSEMICSESGLAGVNRAAEIRNALSQTALYSGIAGIVLLGMIWMSVSFGRNQAYLDGIAEAVQPLASLPVSEQAAGLADNLARLDALRQIVLTAEQQTHDVPLGMRAGLYQGHSVANAARDSYGATLDTLFAPAVTEHFRARIAALASEPDQLYVYLKAYLMLAQPKHLDARELGVIGAAEWRRTFASDPVSGQRVAAHFAALIADSQSLQPAQLDVELVERARTSLQQVSLAVLAYRRLQTQYAVVMAGSLDLSKELGLGAETVFARSSGAPLGQPWPALYTRESFERVSAAGALDVTRLFLSETWVLGEGVASLAEAPRIANEVLQLYERDYIRAWDALIADLHLKPAAGAAELDEQLSVLASPSSPLKRLLVLIQDNTDLLKPAPDGIADRAKQMVSAVQAGGISALAAPGQAEQPGASVTHHFESLHKLIAGAPGTAPIDQTLSALGEIQKRLASQGGGLGEANALDVAASAGQSDTFRRLQLEAKQLPAPIADMVSQVGKRGQSAATGQARDELSKRYRSQVAAECSQLVGGRYPLARSAANDVALADFARLFGYGGVFDTFFKETLAPLVDTSTNPWRWKADAAAIGGSAALLAQFQTAQRIRQIYFRAGADAPGASFSIMPVDLDAAVAKLTVAIDGQTLEYRHGPPRAISMQWPGPAPGMAAVQFEGGGAPAANRTYEGPWALFRMLDDANVRPESDLRYAVSLAAGDRSAKLLLEASSVRNPFGRNELQRFRCEL